VNGRYLLDTNIIIALFAKDPQIHDRIANAEEVFVPCIAVGELYFGACKSIKTKENLARIDEFALNNTVRALKKYPFSLQHTFFDPSKLAPLKIHKLTLRAQTREFSTLRLPRWVPQKIYEFALRGLLQSLGRLCKGLTVFVCDTETARKYGAIKTLLREKGQPIPENDIWIAAIAQQHGLTLVTKDVHFDTIGHLRVEKW